jgi:4-amino-4-deoxychorismate lyase
VRSGRLVTPELSRCGVLGIMRGLVLEAAARIGLETEVRPVDPGELYGAEGAFLCNCLVGVWPIRELGAERTQRYGPCAAVARLTEALGEYAVGAA